MLLAIGPAGRYFIVALVILLVLCVGVYLAYRSQSRGRKGGHRSAG